MSAGLTRRTVLQAALVSAGASVIAACTTNPPTASRPTDRTPTLPNNASKPVLLAYFSRPGQNYWNGGRRDLATGNTEVLATVITGLVDCDVFRIQPVDPYSDNYDDTVARNVREQDADARPAITGSLPTLDGYDTVLLGSPIWNVRPPQIMATFLESVDVTGKRLLPFVTYAVSGLGSAQRDYKRLAPGATIADGLALRGEQAADARTDVERWLRNAGLLA